MLMAYNVQLHMNNTGIDQRLKLIAMLKIWILRVEYLASMQWTTLEIQKDFPDLCTSDDLS